MPGRVEEMRIGVVRLFREIPEQGSGGVELDILMPAGVGMRTALDQTTRALHP